MNIIALPALMLIDVQQGIDVAGHWGGNRNNPDAEKNIQTLLSQWRAMNFPVIMVQHNSVSPGSPFRPGQSGNLLKAFAEPRDLEKVIKKASTSAFAGTNLLDYLNACGIRELFITGFVTNSSVEATVRTAGDLGFDCVVVSDATACFDKIGIDGSKYPSELIHQISLSNLAAEYARVLTTSDVLAVLKDHTQTRIE